MAQLVEHMKIPKYVGDPVQVALWVVPPMFVPLCLSQFPVLTYCLLYLLSNKSKSTVAQRDQLNTKAETAKRNYNM